MTERQEWQKLEDIVKQVLLVMCRLEGRLKGKEPVSNSKLTPRLQKQACHEGASVCSKAQVEAFTFVVRCQEDSTATSWPGSGFVAPDSPPHHIPWTNESSPEMWRCNQSLNMG